MIKTPSAKLARELCIAISTAAVISAKSLVAIPNWEITSINNNILKT